MKLKNMHVLRRKKTKEMKYISEKPRYFFSKNDADFLVPQYLKNETARPVVKRAQGRIVEELSLC